MDTKLIYEDETYAIRGAIYEVYKSCLVGLLTGGSKAANISKTCISIAAFCAAEGASEHSVVKISTKYFQAPKV